MTKTKVPKIRFRGFTEEWENEILGKIADIVGGGTPSTTITEYWDGDIDWYSPAEIGTKVFVNGSKRKITKLGFENSSARILPISTVLFSSRAGIGSMAILTKEGSTNQGFQSIIPFQNILDSYFIYSKGKELKKYGETVGAGSTFVEVSGKQMEVMPLYIPSYTEQIQIGNYFQKLDDLISKTSNKLDKLKNMKQACLSKMFPQKGATTPQVRFRGFTKEWEEKMLGETDSYYTDGNYGSKYPSQSDMTDAYDGVPFIRGSNLQNGKIIEDGTNYITKQKHKELLSGHLVEDDIVITVRGSLGQLGYVEKENINWNINSQLAIIRTDKNELLGAYIIQYLLSNIGQALINSKITGSALKQLPIGQLKNIVIPISKEIEEQTQIGNFFKNLDNLIALNEKQLSKLQNVKASCLDKMFVNNTR